MTVAADMVEIAPGDIVLRDEGTRTEWKVELAAFEVATCPVTRELYEAVVGAAPSAASAVGSAGPRTPVTEVSWLDAVRFCNLLSIESGLRPCYSIGDYRDAEDVICSFDLDGYRLPTEAEWEYASRAGTTGVRYGDLDEIAWYRANSSGLLHDVGGKAPNAWGLYDTIGNVWEWCWDLYDPTVYGPYRVFRGGGWQDLPHSCRSPCRRKSHPTLRIDDLGFRLARSL